MCGRGWSTLVLSLGTSCWGLPRGGDQSASSIPLVPVGTRICALPSKSVDDFIFQGGLKKVDGLFGKYLET